MPGVDSTKMLDCINLYQPWADAMVSGKLPILIRSFSTLKRGTVGIVASESIDGVFFNILRDDEIDQLDTYLYFGAAIGTVDLRDCEVIKKDNIQKELRKRCGKEATYFYPAHLIPSKERVFFWTTTKPVRFRNPVPIARKAMLWSKIPAGKLPVTIRKGFWDFFEDSRYLRINQELGKQLDTNPY